MKLTTIPAVHTGTTANTNYYTFSILPNEYENNSTINVNMKLEKTVSTGNLIVRIKHTESNTVVAYVLAAATQKEIRIEKFFDVIDGYIEFKNASVSTPNDIGTSTVNVKALFDITQANNFVIQVQLAVSTDTVQLRSLIVRDYSKDDSGSGTTVLTGLENFKVTVIGDSISTANTSYGLDVDTYWVGRLKDKYNWNTTGSSCLPGTTISERAGESDGFTDRVTSIPTDSDIYIITGGINDFINSVPLGVLGSSDKQEFHGALAYIFQYLQTVNPTAKIYIWNTLATPNYTLNSLSLSQMDYVNAIEQSARYYNVGVVNSFQDSGLNKINMVASGTYTVDGLHPNALGHERISIVIEKKLLN